MPLLSGISKMEIDKHNCTFDAPPNITELFSELTGGQTVLLGICGAFLLAVIVLYVIESVLLIRQQGTQTYVRHLIFIQGTYTAYALMSFLALISPLSILLCEFVFAIYFSFTLKELIDLMLHILEHSNENCDYEELEESTTANSVSLAAPPLACCFVCICPRVKVNDKFFHITKIGVYQAVLIRPTLTFVEAILWTNGYYGLTKEDFGIEMLEVINAVAVLVAMYFMKLLYNSHEDVLKPHHITVKFYCIQTVMVIVSLQQAIFRLLVQKGAIPCHNPFNSKVRGSDIHHVLVLPEMLLLLLISGIICRKRIPQISLVKETTPLLVDEPVFE